MTVVETREEVEKRLAGKVRKVPTRIAGDIFQDKEFQRMMNSWMLSTHILWGISLAFTFIALNYLLIWLSPPAWEVAASFGPIGMGYTVYQWMKWRRKPKDDAINSVVTKDIPQ